MRRPFGHRERELAAFAAAAAHLIPGEVTGNVIDAVERLKQIAGQHDVLHQLGDLPVANHVTPTGREREVLQHRLAAECPAGIHAELDVTDEIGEPDTVFSSGDVRVGHPNDRRVTERHRAGIAGGSLAQLRRGLARVQAPDEDAFLDEGRVLGGRAFVIIGQRPAQACRGAVAADVQDRLSEAPAEGHHLARLGILVDEIGLGEMSKRLVDEHTRQLIVENHRVGAAAHARGREQVDRALRHDAKLRLEVLDAVPALA